MQHIELYLEKFKTIGGDDFLFKKKICTVVNQICNIGLQEEEIRLGNGIAYLSISGVRKTEFELYRDKIVEALNSKLSLK